MNMNHSVLYIVEQVYASGCLGKAKRQRDLLSYLLTENRAGRLGAIKEYNIAVDVFGRPDDFTPSTDSIVRAEMRRLRRNLIQFNGQSQGVRLEIPRASFEVVTSYNTQVKPYAPIKSFYKPIVFASTALAFIAALSVANYSQPQGSMIASNCSAVVPNVTMVNSGSSTDLQLYVGKIIQSSLSQYTNIHFVENIEACADSGTPSFSIDYMVLEKNDTYRIALTTYSEQTSNIVSLKDIRGINTNPNDKTDLYYAIVRSVGNLAKPYGTISRRSLNQNWGQQQAFNNYSCLMSMHDAITTDSLEDYNRAYNCLEVAASTSGASLDIKAGLAGRFLDQVRGYRPKTVDNPLLEIKSILDESGNDWITSVEMTLIKIAYEVERPDFNMERFETILNLASENYQENPHILLLVATYTGLKIGNWEQAKHLVEKVRQIHTEMDDSVFLVDAAYSLLHDTPDDIMQTCKLAYSENSLFSNVVVNGCARYAQDSEWTTRTETSLAKLQFTTPKERSKFIENKHFDSYFTTELIIALNLPLS